MGEAEHFHPVTKLTIMVTFVKGFEIEDYVTCREPHRNSTIIRCTIAIRGPAITYWAQFSLVQIHQPILPQRFCSGVEDVHQKCGACIPRQQ